MPPLPAFTHSPKNDQPYALTVKPVCNGSGIFAGRTFRRGAILCEIKGKIVSGEEVWRYWEFDARPGENGFRFDDDHDIDPDGQIVPPMLR